MNLGFTGLSAVGLGGLKGVKMARDAAKVGDKAFDLKKLLSGSEEVAGVLGEKSSVGNSIKNIGKLTEDLANISVTKGKKLGTEEAEKIISKLATNETLTKQELKAVEKLSKITKGTQNPTTVEGIKKDLTSLIDYNKSLNPEKLKKFKLLEKVKVGEGVKRTGKGLASAAMVAQGLPAASSIYEDAKAGGIQNIKTDDIQRLGMAASYGGQ